MWLLCLPIIRRDVKTRRPGPRHRHKPEILLFDEPTSGLDPITGDIVDNLMLDAVKRLGATALTISHDMASVHRIADGWR